ACRHERRAQLLERDLRTNSELSLTNRMDLLRDVSAATDSRDRCLERLKLNESTEQDFWAVIEQAHSAPGAPEREMTQDAPNAIQNAADASKGDLATHGG